MLQRHHFAKGYMVHAGYAEERRMILVEESYAGDQIEIVVGAPDLENSCPGEEDETCSCEFANEYRIALSKEQVKELMFCINQLHFIDKEKK